MALMHDITTQMTLKP